MRNGDSSSSLHRRDERQSGARLGDGRTRARLGFGREFLVAHASQRRAQLLRKLVINAELQRLLIAGLVGVDRLLLDDDDHFLQLVAIDLLLVARKIACAFSSGAIASSS